MLIFKLFQGWYNRGFGWDEIALIDWFDEVVPVQPYLFSITCPASTTILYTINKGVIS